MFDDTVVLATSWLNQDQLGSRPARTLLVGAAVLAVRERFGSWSFDLQLDSTTVTDDPANTLRWLPEALPPASRLLLWRPEDIVVPSLVAAANSADSMIAAKLLRRLDAAFAGEVIDVAAPHGGARATSFDAVAHVAGLPFVAMTQRDLAATFAAMNHGNIRDHLGSRVKAMWRLWLNDQPDATALAAATVAWLAEQDAPT